MCMDFGIDVIKYLLCILKEVRDRMNKSSFSFFSSEPLDKVKFYSESKLKPLSVKYQIIIKKEAQNQSDILFFCHLKEVRELCPHPLWTVIFQEQ